MLWARLVPAAPGMAGARLAGLLHDLRPSSSVDAGGRMRGWLKLRITIVFLKDIPAFLSNTTKTVDMKREKCVNDDEAGTTGPQNERTDET